MLVAAGAEVPEEEPESEDEAAAPVATKRVVPQSVIQRQLANPFLTPDFSGGPDPSAAASPAGDLGADRPAAAARSSARRPARSAA